MFGCRCAILIGDAVPRQAIEGSHGDDVPILREELLDLHEIARVRFVATDKLSGYRERLPCVNLFTRPIKVVFAVLERLELAAVPIGLASVALVTLITAFGLFTDHSARLSSWVRCQCGCHTVRFPQVHLSAAIPDAPRIS
jgi:hypothetical protein